MAFKIERALTGLFGALKLQSQGNLPYFMREDVQPTFDLNPWVHQAIGVQVIQAVSPIAFAGVGQIGTYTQTEDLWIYNARGVCQAGGAGDNGLLTIFWQANGASASFELATMTRVATNAATGAGAAGETRCTPDIGEPFFSPVGAIWSLFAHSAVVAVGLTGYLNLQVLRIPRS